MTRVRSIRVGELKVKAGTIQQDEGENRVSHSLIQQPLHTLFICILSPERPRGFDFCLQMRMVTATTMLTEA